MQKEFVTISVDQSKLEEIKNHYLGYKVINDGEYVDSMYKYGDLVITIYSGKKENKKITFAGNGALKEALLWDKEAKIKEVKEKQKQAWEFFGSQIGSDEVGVGDFLGPMIVVAAFVRPSDIKDLKLYGVDDSKRLKDQDILDMGPALAKRFFFSKLTLSNEKYNEMIDKGENLNSLKAKMHNRVLLNLIKQYPDVSHIYVDQFVQESTYYKYLNDKNETQVTNIVFKTKGESFYPCVALASVIARYAFLLEMQRLNKKYKMEFPLGASKKVNDFSKEFINKYGIKEFDKICKKNFANYKELNDIKLI